MPVLTRLLALRPSRRVEAESCESLAIIRTPRCTARVRVAHYESVELLIVNVGEVFTGLA